jgi:NADP-dependent 3-hydroxy acid dehydrogenase YdfG
VSRTDRIEALAKELGEQVDLLALTLDVRERELVVEKLTGLPDEFSIIDVLVNNAGLALGLNLADQAEFDHWDTMVDTNIKGLMYCTRAILPGMVSRGAGHVVNIGSVAASWLYPGGNAYGAAKVFVQQFSRKLRADLVGKNIRVSLVEPGMCETEFSMVRFEGDAAKTSSVYEGTQPLAGKDVADIVYWTTQVPALINVNQLEVMPLAQAWSLFAVHRDS